VVGSSYLVKGKVTEKPRTIVGGHVIFRLATRKGQAVDCAAYEPAKSFRSIIRELVPGDEIEVMGELRGEPRTLNLEKIHVMKLAVEMRKISNPGCPKCGKAMRSIGQGMGYRCRVCGARSKRSEAIVEKVPRGISLGWYEPPVCARRHISKPLKRMCL